MGRGIALQLLQSTVGIRLVAVANRHLEKAERAYVEAGVEDARQARSVTEVEEAIRRHRHVIVEDPLLLCRARGIDVVIEVTGTIEYAARVTLDAISHGKHVVLLNAELDSTLGPLLQVYARRAGVVLTNADGDQPGVLMNLYRFVKGIGVRPVLCGNIKGLQDHSRNPTSQAGYAETWGQNPMMVTSFADGTKISFEQAVVANATGMRVGKRGMFGPTVTPGTPVTEAVHWYPEDLLLGGRGLVDYVVGAAPGSGVFVLGTHDSPRQRKYLALYKVGEGPFYCFYTPYHLCHFEVPSTIARAVDFADATVAALDGPVVDVVATAKIDLQEGEVIDGIGGYKTYGQCENADVVYREQLLPMGLAEGCRLRHFVTQHQVLTYADVDVPTGRLSDQLRHQQNEHFLRAQAQLLTGQLSE